MFNRRQLMGVVPASALAVTAARVSSFAEAQEAAENGRSLIASPPVVQNPRANSFGVSIAVGSFVTAWVEYGFSKDDLPFTATASHHGLIHAADRAIHIRVNHPNAFPTDQPIYYRVVVQPLRYRNAYQLDRGTPEATDTFALRLPNPAAEQLRVVSINDTHENLATITKLHDQIETLQPDLLIWNGDTCNDFDETDSPEQILLNPAKNTKLSWASNRPLLFSNGNHDVRGRRARDVAQSFVSCPESSELPYNQALRFGPLAIITLDTGEDKPDKHPVFAGTAAYEPYREQQALWLKRIVDQPAIRDAKFRIAAAHIPLRGLDGQNDGTTLIDYARYSGFGAKLWLPTLKEAGFHAILAGHTHRHRLDQPTSDMPIRQFVGGGPRPEQATVTIIDAQQDRDGSELDIRICDLSGKVLHQQQWTG